MGGACGVALWPDREVADNVGCLLVVEVAPTRVRWFIRNECDRLDKCAWLVRSNGPCFAGGVDVFDVGDNEISPRR